MSHACSICAEALEPQSRYPRYVCSDGGYAARYADTGEPYESHDCWLAKTKPAELLAKWPLHEGELRPLFVDLGVALSSTRR